jgi:hypothetical protein
MQKIRGAPHSAIGYSIARKFLRKRKGNIAARDPKFSTRNLQRKINH